MPTITKTEIKRKKDLTAEEPMPSLEDMKDADAGYEEKEPLEEAPVEGESKEFDCESYVASATKEELESLIEMATTKLNEMSANE